MSEDNSQLMEAAVAAFLSLVPALAEEIERSVPIGATAAERLLHRRQKGWAELCHSAQRTGIDPLEFARQVVRLGEEDRRMRH